MDIFDFINDTAILSIGELHDYDDPVWLVITNSRDNSNFYAAKTEWVPGGVVDHMGRPYDECYDSMMIYFCQNKINQNEFFSIHDFMYVLNNGSSLNAIFKTESDADAYLSTLSLVRTSIHPSDQLVLDEIINQRSFAFNIESHTTLFSDIQKLDPKILSLARRIG